MPLEPRFRRHHGRLLRDGEEVGRIDGPPLGLAVDLGTTTVVVRLIDLETGEIEAGDTLSVAHGEGETFIDSCSTAADARRSCG